MQDANIVGELPMAETGSLRQESTGAGLGRARRLTFQKHSWD